MGWISYHRAPGQSDLDHFRTELLGTDLPGGRTDAAGRHLQLVDGATKNNTFYGALQVTPAGGAPYTTALVCLIFRGRGAYNFGYKDMDESAGPAETLCPQRILDLLSPIEDCEFSESGAKHAGDWREACAAYNAAASARPAVPTGSIVVLDRPLRFGGERLVSVFQAIDGRRKRYRALAAADENGAFQPLEYAFVTRLGSRDAWGPYRVFEDMEGALAEWPNVPGVPDPLPAYLASVQALR